MDFIKVAKTSDFANRKYNSLNILSISIGIFKSDEGTFYAMEAHCKHQNANLLAGRVENWKVTCNRHGWVYDLQTGACLHPGHEWAKLRRFPLKIIDDQIWIALTPIEEEEDETL